jgi:hypothetical protein|nr:MAG TPA: hypothetical protein [Caudoviricetes sp.]
MMEEMQSIDIKSIKYSKSGQKLIINFDKNVNGNLVEYQATYTEEPRPEFVRAFSDLAGDVLDILDFSKIEGMIDRIHPYGLTIRRQKSDGALRAIITAKLDVPQYNTCIAINTPILTEMTSDNKGESGSYFNAATVKKIQNVLNETYLYITGKRAQMSLFEEDDDLSGGADEIVPASGVHTETARSERIAAASTENKAVFN